MVLFLVGDYDELVEHAKTIESDTIKADNGGVCEEDESIQDKYVEAYAKVDATDNVNRFGWGGSDIYHKNNNQLNYPKTTD